MLLVRCFFALNSHIDIATYMSSIWANTTPVLLFILHILLLALISLLVFTLTISTIFTKHRFILSKVLYHAMFEFLKELFHFQNVRAIASAFIFNFYWFLQFKVYEVRFRLKRRYTLHVLFTYKRVIGSILLYCFLFALQLAFMKLKTFFSLLTFV